MSFQFRNDFFVCPNPLGIDPYPFCENNCRFCSFKMWELGWQKKRTEEGLRPINTHNMVKTLDNAFPPEREYKDVIIRALRADLPVIVGRKCEPFCRAEEKFGATKKVLEILDRHYVPTLVETRETRLVFDYVAARDTKCGVSIGMLFGDEKVHNAMEPETSSYEDRWRLAKELKDSGIWVGMIAEPVLMSYNDNPEFIEDYARRAAEAGVDHVNFGELRVSGNVRTFADRLGMAGMDLVESMKKAQTDWKTTGRRIFEVFQNYGVDISSPDWVNFSRENSQFSCCGLSDFHSCHAFNFQQALVEILNVGEVTLKTMMEYNVFGEDIAEKFKKVWNGSGDRYTLADVDWVTIVGHDDEGNKIYGADERKELSEVFA